MCDTSCLVLMTEDITPTYPSLREVVDPCTPYRRFVTAHIMPSYIVAE